jgi:large subunit ribosomal protein L16
MLCPKKIKYRKVQKGRISGIENRSTSLLKGSFGIKSLSYGRISSQQLESARRSMSRKMRRHGKIWIRIFPYLPVTSKPAEVRMGKGKGNLKYWCFPIKPGRIIFEFHGISSSLASEISKLVNSKLPVLTKMIKKI